MGPYFSIETTDIPDKFLRIAGLFRFKKLLGVWVPFFTIRSGYKPLLPGRVNGRRSISDTVQ